MIKKFLLSLIKLYQVTLSPDHGVFSLGSAFRCRFYPSCSEYAYQSIEREGIIIGLTKSVWRIIKCGPWSKGGIDNINPKSK